MTASRPTRVRSERPALRPVDAVVVPDEQHGRALLLRDTEGVTTEVAVIPAPLIPIVARFDGRRTIEQIARELEPEGDIASLSAQIEQIAGQLDEALLLDSPRYRAERARCEADFMGATVRPAAHAGGAYHADAAELTRFLEDECFGAVERITLETTSPRALVGLVAPHIDPWRGRVNYGHAYELLRPVASRAETFVLLGTSHAPMREPFALCRKDFDTPLGRLEADVDAIDAIAQGCLFDPYRDGYNHKREHSLEIQAVFIRYLTRGRAVRIIPVLCGHGSGAESAEQARAVDSFLTKLRDVCQLGAVGRAVVVAGADLAHVGPRFGDAAPYDREARARLERTDRASLDLAARLDASGFLAHVSRDLDTRRVCGLAPIYALVRLMPAGATGRVLRYEQTVDPEEGSIVSHAAVGYFAPAPSGRTGQRP